MKLRKLVTTLSLIAVAIVGVGITSQSARACIGSIEIINMETGEVHRGFISCGSSAGNYVADLETGWTGDTEAADLLCALGLVC
ncbi:MAG TPA: hypothetical protein VF791_06565 [Pyrinomonadaceae bacterium]